MRFRANLLLHKPYFYCLKCSLKISYVIFQNSTLNKYKFTISCIVCRISEHNQAYPRCTVFWCSCRVHSELGDSFPSHVLSHDWQREVPILHKRVKQWKRPGKKMLVNEGTSLKPVRPTRDQTLELLWHDNVTCFSYWNSIWNLECWSGTVTGVWAFKVPKRDPCNLQFPVQLSCWHKLVVIACKCKALSRWNNSYPWVWHRSIFETPKTIGIHIRIKKSNFSFLFSYSIFLIINYFAYYALKTKEYCLITNYD